MKRSFLPILLLAILSLSVSAQQKIGNNPTIIHSTAALELESTTKGFLPPRMTTTQRDAIASPAQGLSIFNTTINCMEWYNGIGWYNPCDGATVGLLITSGTCLGLPSIFTFNGRNYKPVESGGRCWLDRNLGASQVATSANDAASFGDLYQWGRSTEGHQVRTSVTYNGGTLGDPPTAIASGAWNGQFIYNTGTDWIATPNDNLWQGVSGVNNPCPSGWRLPTITEFGTESGSWSSQDLIGAFQSPLKIPTSGWRQSNASGGTIFLSSANFWSSSHGLNVNQNNADLMNVYAASVDLDYTAKANATSIRCIKN